MNLDPRTLDTSDIPLPPEVANPLTFAGALAYQALAQGSDRMPVKPEPTDAELILGILLETGPRPQVELRAAFEAWIGRTQVNFDTGLHTLRHRPDASAIITSGETIGLSAGFPRLGLQERDLAHHLAAQRHLHAITTTARAELANSLAQQFNLSQEAQQFLGGLLNRSPFPFSIGGRAARPEMMQGRTELLAKLRTSDRYQDLVSTGGTSQNGQIGRESLVRTLLADGIQVNPMPAYSTNYPPVSELLIPQGERAPLPPLATMRWYENPTEEDWLKEWELYADALDQAIRPLQWLQAQGIADVSDRLAQLEALQQKAEKELDLPDQLDRVGA